MKKKGCEAVVRRRRDAEEWLENCASGCASEVGVAACRLLKRAVSECATAVPIFGDVQD